MIDKLTAEERLTVEALRARVANPNRSLDWPMIQIVDRLAPKPPPKTDQELAGTIEQAMIGDIGYYAALVWVRDALRARGTK